MNYIPLIEGRDGMTKIYRGLTVLFCALVCVCTSSCGKKDDDANNLKKNTPTKDYDLYIYNTDRQIDEDLVKMCEEYSSRSGVAVKCVTPDEDEDAAKTLESQMNSDQAPDIFTIGSMQELKKWQDSGNVLDFSNATETQFKDIANGIPQSLRLSSNTVDNFGMPYTVQGFGYIVDPKMLSSLLGGDKYRAALSDLKVCTYNEFESFVNAVRMFIDGGSANEFQLNGHSYTMLNKKGGLADNLNAVFSFPAGVPVYTDYVLNSAMGAAFCSAAEANVASDEKIASCLDVFSGFAKSLDLITLSVAGKNGGMSRGISLVDSINNNPTQALKSFVAGQSLFLIGQNSIYDSMFLFDSSLANRVSFIPIKMPLDSLNISAQNMTEKLYSSSIVVSVPRYFAINAKAGEKQHKLAQDFLVWFKTSKNAQKYILQSFKFIPYDITESSAIDNQLSRSMVEYISSGHILPAAVNGLPETMNDSVAQILIDKYYPQPDWAPIDYDAIGDQIIKIWEKLK